MAARAAARRAGRATPRRRAHDAVLRRPGRPARRPPVGHPGPVVVQPDRRHRLAAGTPAGGRRVARANDAGGGPTGRPPRRRAVPCRQRRRRRHERHPLRRPARADQRRAARDHRGRVAATDRRSFGLPDAGTLFVNAARLAPEKAQTLLVEAFAAARRHLPDAQLAIAGAPGVAEPSVRDAIARHDLGTAVHLLGWRADVRFLVATADVFVFSSLSEGWPSAVVEAMAMGPRSSPSPSRRWSR